MEHVCVYAYCTELDLKNFSIQKESHSSTHPVFKNGNEVECMEPYYLAQIFILFTQFNSLQFKAFLGRLERKKESILQYN